jgi:uracil-DNA glycosylase
MNIKTEWLSIIQKCIDFNDIEKHIEDHYQKHDFLEIYPSKELIFNSFNFFNPNELKVVILGQDPYINKGQAMGLSFSVPKGIKIPPSLQNIFKEIKNEYPDYEYNTLNGDLSNWAKQGILLLNSSLTVIQGKSNSYKNFWTEKTDNIIKYISENMENIIFVLWGNDAQKKENIIDIKKHKIIKSVHPSPLSASRGFFGNQNFKLINEYLISIHKNPIIWTN